MRQLTLTEGAASRPVSLTDAEAEALAMAEVVVVTRTPGADSWLVAAGSKVGVARVGDLQVTVRPKIAIDRLVFLMGYAQRPKFWRDQSVELDEAAELPDALAHAFTRLATKALEQGVLQGYQVVEDSLPVLRGRVRVRDQISRRFGLGLPLEVSYDDFTIDIAENQILLAAAMRLLRMPGLSKPIRHLLQRLRMQLGGVAEIDPGHRLPTWRPSRLNARYQAPLQLAEMILAGESFELRVGDLQVSGFVFDMWRIFEDFVCIALREALAAHGTASLQHHMHLDQAERVTMQPDFLWTAFEGQQVVVDAKYKAEQPAGFPQADLYQLLAYCTALRLPEGHLVYAAGNGTAAAHHIQGTDVTIHCHTLDLAQPPKDLLEHIEGLASRFSRVTTRRADTLTSLQTT